MEIWDRFITSDKQKVYKYFGEHWNDERELFLNIVNKDKNNSFKIGLEYEKAFLRVLKENHEEDFIKILPQFINDLSTEAKKELIKNDGRVLKLFPIEFQKNYFINDKFDRSIEERLAYASPEVQKYYIDSSLEGNLKYASKDIQKEYVKKDLKNFKRISKEVASEIIKESPDYLRYLVPVYQISIVNENINLFEKMSIEAKIEYMTSEKEGKPSNKIIKVLEKDARNSRYLRDIGTDFRYSIFFDGLEEKNMEEIKKVFFCCKFLSAYGNMAFYDVMHNQTGRGQNCGVVYDFRNKAVIKQINKLSPTQVAELIKVDSNYVLQYIDFEDRNYRNYTEKEIISAKNKCKNIFKEIYENGKFENFEDYIDVIFDMQANEKRKEEFKNKSKMPIHDLKILFNKTIMNSEGFEKLFKKYFDKVKSNQDSSIEFYKIIENAYGNEARRILESRPGLDVHEINSLEVFDNRIKSIFEGRDYLSYEAFVHNCLSYNIENFSGFLDIVKDENKRKNFATYFEILENIMGDNVGTVQKAINEFDYIEELMKNIQNIDLNEKQEENFLKILCSNGNPCGTNDINGLNNYDNIIQQEILLSSPRLAFELHFGVDFSVASDISKLYDISTYEIQKYKYFETERCILNALDFCLNNYDNIEFYKNTSCNPLSLYSAIERTREYQTAILKSNLLTSEDLDESIIQSKDMENPNIYLTEEDGVKIYHLVGKDQVLQKKVLVHNPFGNISLKDFLEYDGQLGNTAICTRYAEITEEIKPIPGVTDYSFIFSKIDEDMLIDVCGTDARTTHAPKMVFNSGLTTTKVINVDKLAHNCGNEVAFYRRHRNSDKIGNDNYGGKIKPDFIVPLGKYFDEETLKYMKKYNISGLVFEEREKEKDSKEENTNEQER